MTTGLVLPSLPSVPPAHLAFPLSSFQLPYPPLQWDHSHRGHGCPVNHQTLWALFIQHLAWPVSCICAQYFRTAFCWFSSILTPCSSSGSLPGNSLLSLKTSVFCRTAPCPLLTLPSLLGSSIHICDCNYHMLAAHWWVMINTNWPAIQPLSQSFRILYPTGCPMALQTQVESSMTDTEMHTLGSFSFPSSW